MLAIVDNDTKSVPCLCRLFQQMNFVSVLLNPHLAPFASLFWGRHVPIRTDTVIP